MGRDDIATAYIGQLSQAQVDLQKTGHQYEHAQLASKQALKARDNYVLQMQRRSAEAMQLINQSKQARLQEQLAQTMESFQIGDDASTFNEMRDKIDRRAAAAEAKMQLGSASVDNQMQEIEREAMDMQLQDKLLQYKREMGLLPAGSSDSAQQALPAQGETTPQQ
jgi:phage shock protein A